MQILVFEDEVCAGSMVYWGGVEEGIARGDAADGETKWGSILEGESEVRGGV